MLAEDAMGSDPRKRQKKLERRAAKRKEKKHLLVREQSAGLPERLTAAARFPVLYCGIGESLEPEGIAWVLLSRELPNGQVAAASFLVDRYCLGVKNVFAEVLGRSAYNSKYVQRMRSDMALRSVAPAEARKLLEEAVAYARGLGLSPHPDYPKALLLFGDVNPAESDARFEFGKDGQPFFVAGPNDTPERCQQIMAILRDTCGPGRFHYLLPVPGGDFGKAIPSYFGPGKLRMIGPEEVADEEHMEEPEDFDDNKG